MQGDGDGAKERTMGEGKRDARVTGMYLDVLRWIFEGQEHVTIPAALRRSLSHLQKDHFTFFLLISVWRARARELPTSVHMETTCATRPRHPPRHRGGWVSERERD